MQLDSLEKPVAELRCASQFYITSLRHHFIPFQDHSKPLTWAYENIQKWHSSFNQEFFGMTGAVDIINSTLGKVGIFWEILQSFNSYFGIFSDCNISCSSKGIFVTVNLQRYGLKH